MRPLEGIVCLELGHIVAGPTASLLLAELGARVIKIESPNGGDQARKMAKQSSGIFAFLNHNKESLVLDLKSEGGRRHFYELAESADIIVSNMGPGVVERLHVDYESIHRRNSRLVYATIQGFLPGPNESRPLLDEMAQMAGGLAYMTGPAGHPLRAGASIVDIGAATYAVVGILGALRLRDITGEGSHVHSGLFETVAFWVGQHVTTYSWSQERPIPYPSRATSTRMGWGIYDLFRSHEGVEYFIGVTSDKQWEAFCRAFGRPDLARRSDLATNRDRLRHREELIPELAMMFADIPSKELVARLEYANVPYAAVQSPDELIRDRHMADTDSLIEVQRADDGTPIFGIRPPWRISSADLVETEPPPELGENKMLKDKATDLVRGPSSPRVWNGSGSGTRGLS